jgi:2-polyprenyl-6-methoxyphenol hydroxylase-like FAD-dependent oxidoreductase
MTNDVTPIESTGIEKFSARVCITGGGPAGVVLGFLLARAGINTLVLEKHADFLRDFRGDTIHPSTMEVMHELGLLGDFLKRPHQEYHQAGISFGGTKLTIGDFSHLPVHSRFIALMPQWDFLDFISQQGRRYPNFRMQMRSEVTDLMVENGRVAGVTGKTPTGMFEVRADLTIGADGRHSVVRQQAGLQVDDLGAPIDVLWMRMSRHPDDPLNTLGNLKPGKMLVTIDRGDYWQCAWIILKGAFQEVQRRGLPALRADIVDVAPYLSDRVAELADWKDLSLLSVRVDRLREWSRPGLLCIGDCAHAMSPVGGVGINLAIQDAVAAANILVPALRRTKGDIGIEPLRQVQKRREFPTRMTQSFQVAAHNRVVHPLLKNELDFSKIPLPLRMFRAIPILRRIPARIIGLGFRPEHVKTQAASS